MQFYINYALNVKLYLIFVPLGMIPCDVCSRDWRECPQQIRVIKTFTKSYLNSIVNYY